MKRVKGSIPLKIAWLAIVISLATAQAIAAQPNSQAAAAFNAYIDRLEARLDAQHHSGRDFLAPLPAGSSLAGGNIVLERLTADGGAEVSGALLHHWRGTAFVQGATAAQFHNLLGGFAVYPRVFAPQVVRASVPPDHQVTMRVVQHHVITVVLDTTYAVAIGQVDPCHRYSTSRSTRIAEIENTGTPRERVLTPEQAHGFLWRLNTYWSYEERDGGLYLQIESVSLTRGIPAGLGWIVRPFIESVPRQSIAFTLRAASKALQNENQPGNSR